MIVSQRRLAAKGLDPIGAKGRALHRPPASTGPLRLAIAAAAGMGLAWTPPGPSGSAMAQAVTPPPPAPSSLAQPALPTRETLEQPTQAPPQAAPRLKVESQIEAAPCALDNPAYAKVRFKLTKTTFANLGPVPESALADTYAQYLGTEQPIGVVCRIRDAAATALRAMGYIAAVEVPVQRISNGEVRFEVLYARISSVRVVGQAGRNARVFQSLLQRLIDGKPFNRDRAERIILLARDIPGYQVRLTLKPSGTGAGNMIAEISLQETPLAIDFTGSNLSSAYTGRFGGQLRVNLNGLTGMGDHTTLAAYSTSDFEEQQIYQFGHDLALGSDGLRLGVRANYAITRPGLGPTVPGVTAHTLFTNLEASYPLVRRLAFTMRAATGLDLLNQQVSFGGAPLSRDRLRVAYLRLDMDAIDLKGVGPGGSIGWRAVGSLELRKGLDILGDSPNCVAQAALCRSAGYVPPSLSVGDPRATVFRASGTVEANIIRGLTLALSPRAQVASAPVFAFEQLSLGNFTIGRGFDPGAVAGDSGVALAAEARLRPFQLNQHAQLDIQPYAFTDNGWIWHKLSPIPSPEVLTSVGAGVRFTWASQARLDLSGAFPLSRVAGESQRRDARVLATLAVNILPWRPR